MDVDMPKCLSTDIHDSRTRRYCVHHLCVPSSSGSEQITNDNGVRLHIYMEFLSKFNIHIG